MKVLFRNTRKYISRRVDWPAQEIRQGVQLWNQTFNIGYFDFRKRIRRYIFEILKSQADIEEIFVCLNWKEICDYEKYKDQIIVPMDDDDILLVNPDEYEKIRCTLDNSPFNGVITGYYHGHSFFDGKFGYELNPSFKLLDTNNLFYKNCIDVHNNIVNLPLFHTNSDIDTLRTTEMRQIVTSLHFCHPCSISSLQKYSGKEQLIEQVEKYTNCHDTDNLPEKFIPHVNNVIDIYLELNF